MEKLSTVPNADDKLGTPNYSDRKQRQQKPFCGISHEPVKV
jgi:hypothetical protein